MSLFPIPIMMTLEVYVKSCATVFLINGSNNKDYFARVFKIFEKGNFFAWNWPAFAISVFSGGALWLVAKRLYLHALAVMLLNKMLLSLVYNPAEILQTLSVIVVFNFFLSILLGSFGNYLHYWWMQKWQQKYARLKALYPPGLDFYTINLILIWDLFALLMQWSSIQFVVTVVILYAAHWYWFEKPVTKT